MGTNRSGPTRALVRFWRERRGASAVETAFILPGVLFLALGGGNLVLRDWDLGANAHQAGSSNLPVGPNPQAGASSALADGDRVLVDADQGLVIKLP